jgi:leader peptidase (prepilin peptidase)/N-methyltransferase
MPLTFIWIAILPGLISGLLVNYFADVLPVTRQLTRPICPICKEAPGILDYLLLRPCHHCGTKYSARHWVILAVMFFASLATWVHPSHRLGYWLGILLLVFLGLVVVIDVEYRVVLTQVSLFGLIFGGAIGILTRGFLTAFYGGLAGYGIMLALYLLGAVYSRWIGRKRSGSAVEIPTPAESPAADPVTAAAADEDEVALGFGDVNLAGILGLILGWPVIIAGLLAGILAGGVASLIYILVLVILKRYRISTAMPYAPFLVFGAIVFLYGF